MDDKTFKYMDERVSKYKKLKNDKKGIEAVISVCVDARNNYRFGLETNHKKAFLTGDHQSKYIKMLCDAIEVASNDILKMIDDEMSEI